MRTNATYRGIISAAFNGANRRYEVYRTPDRLPDRRDLHSYPEAFCWGNRSAGAAQLALAILADFLEDDAEALRLHQRFKDEVVADLHPDREWEMTGEVVGDRVEWIREQMAEHRRRERFETTVGDQFDGLD